MSGPLTSLRGGRIYGQHGNRHGPRGSDPGATEPWRNVATSGTTAWSSGGNYDAGDVRDHDNLRWEAIKASGSGRTDPYGNTVGPIEPGVTDGWPAYWWCQASVYMNGNNATPTGAVPNPVPLRYRLSIGAPNYIDIDGTITAYTDHQIDIQGDLASSSLSYGDVVFIMPLEYRHDYDVPYQTHDDVGGFVPCRLLAVTGEFIWNTP